ncbi:1856_t:CDS:2 [Ambispora gerdemannii]|uniref:1856_t:CDS:1 n=1 Tax=Ambispora gerdemannii TaxID=144530 RepID=A0A9N8Z0V1_9GLOM|nr:1856_t:CDS:2 [Ambispora gerdemannii]
MKFSSTILIAASLFASSSIVSGTVYITSPYGSITWYADKTALVTWAEDAKSPKFSEWGDSVSVQLMTGNTQQILVDTIEKSIKPSALQVNYKVKKNLGPEGPYYFIKISSGSKNAYSARFNIQGISGTIKGFDPNAPKTEPNNTSTDDGTKNSSSSASTTNSTTSTTSNPSSSSPTSSGSAKPSSSSTSAATSNKVYTFTGFAVGVLGLALSYLP